MNQTANILVTTVVDGFVRIVCLQVLIAGSIIGRNKERRGNRAAGHENIKSRLGCILKTLATTMPLER